MTPFTLAHARDALRGTLPVPDVPMGGRTAAVAAVLRERDGRVELLFIRRARRRGDPWSGHMAWPGGKREPVDDTIVACAVRETREELGLDLDAHGELVGALTPLRFDGRRATGLRAVLACVFVLRDTPPFVASDEVQEAVWIPLDYFGQWTSRRPWSWLARWLPPVPPAYRYEGRIVWGLTLWMLSDLLKRLHGVAGRT